MSTSSRDHAASSSRGAASWGAAGWGVPLVVGILAFVARLWPVLRGGGLTSVLFYDDGVYYASGASLAHGVLPYRDFMLLHPPGVALVLVPFARLGSLTTDLTGLAAARLAFMAIGACTAVLVFLAASRLSRAAGLFAGLVYAVWLPAVHAEGSAVLEPLGNVTLAGALVAIGDPRTASRRRLVLAGALLGAGCSVKIWSAAPALVVLAWVWWSRRDREALWCAGGLAAAATVICAPFLILAPRAMPRMVLLDQVGRDTNGVSLADRLTSALGIRTATIGHDTRVHLALLAACIVLACAIAVLRWQPAARVWVALLATTAGMLALVPTFYAKYSDFAAVPLALVLGASADLALRWARTRAPAAARVAVPVALVAVLVLVAIGPFRSAFGHDGPADWLHGKVAGAGCVSAEDPMIMIESDSLSRTLRNGCVVVVDPSGLYYDLPGVHPGDGTAASNRAISPPLRQRLRDYLQSTDVFVLDRPERWPEDAMRRCLTSYRRVGTLGGLQVYDTRGVTPSPACGK